MNQAHKPRMVILLLIISLFQLSAQSVYEDNRFLNWRSAFLAGDVATVLKSVESDLKTNAPHPLAGEIWIVCQHKLGIQGNLMRNIPSDLKTKIAINVDAYYLPADIFAKRYSFQQIQSSSSLSVLKQAMRAYLYTNPEQVVKTFQTGLEKFGVNFYLLQLLTEQAQASLIIRTLISERLDNGYFDQFPKVKQYLSLVLDRLDTPAPLIIKAIDLYSDAFAKDPIARYYRASLLQENEQFTEAADSYQSAFDLDPFWLEGRTLIHKSVCLTLLERTDEANEVLGRYAQLSYPKQIKKEERIAKILQLIWLGQLGMARELLWEINPEYPRDPSIQGFLGEVEMRSERYALAIAHYTQAIKLAPYRFENHYQRLLVCLESMDLESILKYLNETEKYYNPLPLAIYLLKGKLLLDQGQLKKGVTFLESALKHYPYSADVLLLLARYKVEQKAFAPALAFVQEAFLYQNPQEEDLKLLESILLVQLNKDDARMGAELMNWAKKFPWVEYLWQRIAQYKISDAQKWVVWESASKLNQGLFFPYKNVQALFLKDQLWDQAIQILEVAIQDLNNKGKNYEEALAHLARAEIIIWKAAKEELGESYYEEAKSDLEFYLFNGGRASIYYQNLGALEFQFDHMDAARQAILQCRAIKPDDYESIVLLETEYQAVPLASIERYRWLMRNPYQASRTRKYVKANLTDQGSPINALLIMHRYGYNWSMLKNRAFQLLGDQFGYYQDQYVKASALPANGDEIELYHQVRRSSWQNDFDVELDYFYGKAKITLADGTIIWREDDPMIGKISRLEMGSTKMEVRYREDGSIRHIVLPQGKSIQFFYNDQNQVTEIINSARQKINLQFDGKGRTTFIKWQGNPDIHIRYDNFGKIQSITGMDTRNAMAVFNKVEDLLNLPETLNSIQSYLLKGNLPDFSVEDPNYTILKNTYDRFSDKIQSKGAQIPLVETGLQFADHLKTNANLKPGYAKEALDILTNLFSTIDQSESSLIKMKGFKVIETYYDLCIAQFQDGLPGKYWLAWQRMQNWLYQQKLSDGTNYTAIINVLQKKIGKQVLKPLGEHNSFGQSLLSVDIFWEDLQFPGASGVKIQAIYALGSGRILLATNSGLYVFNGVTWTLYEYDPTAKAMLKVDKVTKSKEYNDFRDLVVDEQQNIYLAAAAGILALTPDIEGAVRSEISQKNGLNAEEITQVAYQNSEVFIGTDRGLIKNTSVGTLEPVKLPEGGTNARVSFIKSFGTNGKNVQLLIGTGKGLFLKRTNGTILKIHNAVNDAVMNGFGQVFILENGKVAQIINLSDREVPLKTLPLEDKLKPNQLSLMGLDSIHKQLVVVLDKSLIIHGDRGPLKYQPPFTKNQNGKINSVYQGQQMTIIQYGNKVYRYSSKLSTIIPGQIGDLVTIDDLNITLFTVNNSLKYLKNQDGKYQVKLISNSQLGAIKSLVLNGENQVLFSDGSVVRLATYDASIDQFEIKTLFGVDQYTPNGDTPFESGEVKNILVSSDGAIWVCTRLSVFRYYRGSLVEYNYFKNPKLFPAKSGNLYRILETQDGRILVVASQDRDQQYKETILEGGLLEWSSAKHQFDRIPVAENKEWFYHSYTSIGSGQAIIGSRSGFLLENKGAVDPFDSKDQVSYNILKRKHPSLFLGTNGLVVDEYWVFGCSAGLVAYKNGNWIYLEKLNRLLPDDSRYKKYGSRHINALAKDPQGYLYVGTDRGLLIHKFKGPLEQFEEPLDEKTYLGMNE